MRKIITKDVSIRREKRKMIQGSKMKIAFININGLSNVCMYVIIFYNIGFGGKSTEYIGILVIMNRGTLKKIL